VFGFFQQFCWPFLAFFTEGLAFFLKKSGNPGCGDKENIVSFCHLSNLRAQVFYFQILKYLNFRKSCNRCVAESLVNY